MKCTDKEWQHCQVEKRKCEGCAYNKEEIKIDEQMNEALPEWFCNAMRFMQNIGMTDDEIREVLDTFRKECLKKE